MRTSELEERLTRLEKAVAELQKKADAPSANPWESIIGRFANDPVYAEIVRLGKKYRDSQGRDGKRKRKRK